MYKVQSQKYFLQNSFYEPNLGDSSIGTARVCRSILQGRISGMRSQKIFRGHVVSVGNEIFPEAESPGSN